MARPDEALLPDDQAKLFAAALVTALVDNELPANADRDRRGDWRLVTTVDRQGGVVVPKFTAVNPKGETAGSTDGDPVPLAAWAEASPATLERAARSAAPKIATMMNAIDASLRQSDPNSLYNRPARVYVAEVEGAPGDGNRTLAAQMRQQLTRLGPQVQETARGADFAVEGRVHTEPGAGGTLRVEIQWLVRDGTDERGRIVQINEVPPHTLDRYWGEVATVVAQEAAGGVRDVILTQSGRRDGKPAETAKP